MKCHTVQTINRSVAQKILILVRGEICSSEKTRGQLRRSSASSTEKSEVSVGVTVGDHVDHVVYVLIQRTEGVATSYLASDIEVLLAKFSGTLSGGSSPFRKSVDGNLCRLIDTDCV